MKNFQISKNLLIVVSLVILSWGVCMNANAKGTCTKALFGKMPDGKSVDLYTLKNKNGMEVKIITYGGAIQSIMVPDKTGKMGDVALGFDTLEGYLSPTNPFFGALVGRYGNRIGKAKFTLGGTTYTLLANNGENSLHGGKVGFNKVIWTAEPFNDAEGVGLKMTYLSKDMEEGFPGNLSVTVYYTLTDANEIKIDYEATTDKETVCNLTNHSYFNLNEDGDVLSHVLMINASRFTPVDNGLIPTGELRGLKGSPLNFMTPEKIGARINQTADEQIKFGSGYDHNYVLDTKGGYALVAKVFSAEKGRLMEVYSTEPGVQFYTGNFLPGNTKVKGGKLVIRRGGFCLETQHYPDSPNKPDFPSTALKPGQKYQTTTIYKFSIAKSIE